MNRRHFLGVGAAAVIASASRSRQLDPRFDDMSDLIEAKMAE